MSQKLNGKIAVVTGGTSGIGLGLAKAFAARGNTVIVTGRTRARLDALAATAPALHGLFLDLDDPASLPALKKEVLASFPALDIVVANAGVSGREDLTAGDWHLSSAAAMIRTNVLGVLATAEAFLRFCDGNQPPRSW